MGVLRDPKAKDGISIYTYIKRMGVSVRAARTASNSQDRAIFRFGMIKFGLDVATVSVGTEGSTTTGDHVEGSTGHLTSHHTHYKAGTKVGGNTPDGIHEAVTESIIITVLGETIKRSVNRHVCLQSSQSVKDGRLGNNGYLCAVVCVV